MRPCYRIAFVLATASTLVFAHTATAADALFWALGSGGLQTTPLATPGTTTQLWAVTSNDLAYDRSSNQFFWGQGTSVMRGNSDGSGSSSFVSTDGTTPVHRIAVDPVGGMVYWADYSGAVKILRAPVGGGAPTTVATPGGLRGIAIDPRPSKRKFYYVDGGVINVSSLDGVPSFSALANALPGDVISIAVDTCANQFVAIGQTTPHPGVPSPFVLQANLTDAGGQVTLFSGNTAIGCTNPVDDAASVQVDSNHQKIYWTTHDCSNNSQIRSGNRDGSGTPAVLLSINSSSQWIRGLQFSAPASCPTIGVPSPAMSPVAALLLLLALAGAGAYLSRRRLEPAA